MAIMSILIEKCDDGNGFVCRGDDGSLPFEGRIHETAEDAMVDLECAYGDRSVWDMDVVSDTEITIKID